MLAEPKPLKPAQYTATIRAHNGWWFKYAVHRLHGIGIPERSVSLHHTHTAARRSAARWVRKPDSGEVLEMFRA